jgi:hypothetical protein
MTLESGFEGIIRYCSFCYKPICGVKSHNKMKKNLQLAYHSRTKSGVDLPLLPMPTQQRSERKEIVPYSIFPTPPTSDEDEKEFNPTLIPETRIPHPLSVSFNYTTSTLPFSLHYM